MTIFIDLDGTIINPFPRLYRIYFNAFMLAGFKPREYSEYCKMKRSGSTEIEIALLSAPPAFAKHYANRRVELIEEMDYLAIDPMLPNAEEFLQSCRGKHKVMLVTSRNDKNALFKQLNLLDIYNLFDKVVISPGNKALAVIRADEHVSDKIVVIGDTEDDISAGKAVGAKTVATLSGMRTREQLELLNPDLIISGMEEEDLFNKLEELL